MKHYPLCDGEHSVRIYGQGADASLYSIENLLVDDLVLKNILKYS